MSTPAQEFKSDVNRDWRRIQTDVQPQVRAREKSLTEREHECIERKLSYAVADSLEECGTSETLTTIAKAFRSWAQEFGKFSQQERFQLAGMIHKLAEDAEQASL